MSSSGPPASRYTPDAIRSRGTGEPAGPSLLGLDCAASGGHAVHVRSVLALISEASKPSASPARSEWTPRKAHNSSHAGRPVPRLHGDHLRPGHLPDRRGDQRPRRRCCAASTSPTRSPAASSSRSSSSRSTSSGSPRSASTPTPATCCCSIFFTGIGLNARISDLVKGGRPLAILVGLTAVLLLLQNLVGGLAAWIAGLPLGHRRRPRLHLAPRRPRHHHRLVARARRPRPRRRPRDRHRHGHPRPRRRLGDRRPDRPLPDRGQRPHLRPTRSRTRSASPTPAARAHHPQRADAHAPRRLHLHHPRLRRAAGGPRARPHAPALRPLPAHRASSSATSSPSSPSSGRSATPPRSRSSPSSPSASSSPSR